MIIIGTAGHIDHGKSTLIAKLTGTDPDRLKEEKERGISIVLGFAYFDLPNGMRCGVIDVPGHEKFVRQMIAGAVGVDVVVLVIAADEGIMPQTREHLDICRLLGVRHGLVTVTKTDLVDPDWLDLVEEEIRDFTAGTFLEGQPILRFSSVDDAVAAAYREALDGYLTERFPTPPRRDRTRPFKLGVDRVFTMRGFGTVVTGTVTSGELRVGDEAELLPDGSTMRVRGIEVHGSSAERVEAGTRAAINLQGVEKSDVHRGRVLVRHGELRPTSMFDATLSVLHNVDKPIEQRSKALVHTGTAQLAATIVLLDRPEAFPGEDAFVQVRLEQPTVVLPGDAYILRGFEILANYGKTQGGGRILDPHPVKHRSTDQDTAASLRVLRDGSAEQRVSEMIRMSGPDGITWSDLRRRCDVSTPELRSIGERLVASGAAVKVEGDDPFFVHRDAYHELRDAALRHTRSYHDRNPARPGISREELRGKVRYGLDPRLFAGLLDELERGSQLVAEGDTVRLRSFSPRMTGRLGEAREKVARLYQKAGLEPPLPAEVVQQTELPDALIREATDVLAREGVLVRVRGDLIFARDAIDGLRTRLVEFLEREGEINTLQFKELTGTSRKYSIPLGEFFDAEKLTLRVGDTVRRLRRRT